MQDRLPPQNIEAEQAVLGAMLIDKEAVATVAEKLVAEDFYREAHRLIFAAMRSLHAKNEPVDMVTLTEALRNENKLEDIGGVAYITLLANVVPTAANVAYYADIVEKNSARRQLIAGGTKIAALGYEEGEDVRGLMDEAEKTVLEISNRKKKSDFLEIGPVVVDTLDTIATLVNNKGGITGLRSGFPELDNVTAGLHPSDFIILAARPSMGKTAFALNVVQNVAIRGADADGAPKRVAFFSLEMSAPQLVQRMLCAEAQVDAQELRIGKVADGDWNNLWSAADRLGQAKIYIDDTPGITVMDMRSRARRLKSRDGLDLVVVDYLQLMQGGGKKSNSDNRQQEVSEISRGLKALARELEVPVIALSQLSRGVESRQSKKPMLSDLRESGSLEQDADIVAFLYREDYYRENHAEDSNITELIVAKHRNGPLANINLFFHNKFTKFTGFSKRPEGK